jgi:single-stranded DNA-binding protein
MTAQITVKGIVGMNPEIKKVGDNKKDNKKVRFTVASGSMKKGVQVTTWYTVEAWNDNIDLVVDRIEKGQLVEVTGKFRSSIYFSEKHDEHRIESHVSLTAFRILPKSQNETVVEELVA